MLRSIEIEGYKCFKHAKFEGFKRVNLITGLNNSGKSCLLEAIFLITHSNELKAIIEINNFRQISMLEVGTLDYLNNLFHDAELDAAFTFSIRTDAGVLRKQYRIEGEAPSSLSFVLEDRGALPKNPRQFVIENLDTQQTERFTFDQIDRESFSGKANSGWMPAGISRHAHVLANQVKKLIEEGKEHLLLKALSCFGDQFIALKVEEQVPHNPPIIYLTSKEGISSRLNVFGDAVSKVLAIVSEIILGEIRYLLIDEFENGLHYTIQKDVWKAVIRLCEELDIQLFATTHSKEFALAYAEAAKELETDSCGFFEIYKRPIPNDIAMKSWDVAQLPAYFEEGLKIRGEA